MKQTSFTTTILRAEKGKYLTQVADVDISDRVIGDTVALGKNDVPANWREISATEKARYERLKDEAINADTAAMSPE